MSERYLIAGLGNPGREYQKTRHNIGFRCVDALAKAHGLAFDKKQGKAKIAIGTIAGRAVILAKPQTYMNLSGDSLQRLAAYYQIPPERILVIFDDMDIPLGTLRIRKSGGTGGHKGMTSIVQRLGGQEFPRIRFGIGRPPGRMDPTAYVLRPFEEEEAVLVDEGVERVVQAVTTWLREGIDNAMSQYNGGAESSAQANIPSSTSESR